LENLGGRLITYFTRTLDCIIRDPSSNVNTETLPCLYKSDLYSWYLTIFVKVVATTRRLPTARSTSDSFASLVIGSFTKMK